MCECKLPARVVYVQMNGSLDLVNDDSVRTRFISRSLDEPS